MARREKKPVHYDRFTMSNVFYIAKNEPFLPTNLKYLPWHFLLLLIWKLFIKFFCFSFVHHISFRCGIFTFTPVKISRYQLFTQKK